MIVQDSRVLVLPSSTTSWSIGSRRRTPRPLVGVVFDRDSPAEEAFAFDLAVAVDGGGGDFFGIGCSSPAAGDTDLVGALARFRERGVEVLVATVPLWNVVRGEGMSRFRHAIDIPFLEVTPFPVSSDLPLPATAGQAPGAHTPPTGTHSGNIARLALRTARLRRRSNAHKRVAISLPAAGEGNERHLEESTGSGSIRSVVGLLYALRHAGFHIERIPADLDVLLSEVDGPSDADGMKKRSSSSASPAAVRQLNLGNVVITPGPGFASGVDRVPPSTRFDPGFALVFEGRIAQTSRADAVIHVGEPSIVQWTLPSGETPSGPCCDDSSIGQAVTIVPHDTPLGLLGCIDIVLALSPPATWLNVI